MGSTLGDGTTQPLSEDASPFSEDAPTRRKPEPGAPRPTKLRRERELGRGESVGRYVVLDRLGAGGMGVVYAAYDPELDRKAALKLLRTATDKTDDEGATRLLREAQAIAQLAHPNVVAVYDVGVTDGDVFIAMEFIEGQTLKTWMRKKKRSWREVLEVMRAAGRGLAAAHAAGLVHRDFKPDNVIVGDDGRTRVLDFGLARSTGTLSEGGAGVGSPKSQLLGSALTQTGTIMGTPAYMAPEQHAGLPADASADQFSFCVVLYEALYRQRPFLGESPDEIADAILDGKIAEPPRSSPVPRWLRSVVRRGLAGDSRDRYPSMDRLLAALSQDPGSVRRRWLVGAAVLGLLGIGTVVATQSRSTQQVCAGAEQKFDGIWDDARREAVEQRFADSGQPFAQRAWEGVERIIDARVAAWIVLHTDACESTRIRKERSEQMLDLQMSCLEQIRHETSALVDLFGEADAALVERSVTAAYALPDPARCGDLRALTAASVELKSEEQRRQVEEARASIARVKALGLAGRVGPGLELAEELEPQVRALDYPPLLAEMLLELGARRWRADQLDEAAAVLTEAVQVAERNGQEETKARALRQLAWVVGYKQSRHEEGIRLARFAESAASQLEHVPDLNSAILETLSTLYDEMGDLERGRQYIERAIEISETSGGKPTSLASQLESLAINHRLSGDLERGVELQLRALEIRQRELGPTHPAVGYSHLNIASVRVSQNEHKLALDRLEQAEAAFESLGPDNAVLAHLHNNRAAALQGLGRHKAALAEAERSIEVAARALGKDHPQVAGGSKLKGGILAAMGRHEAAIEAYQTALSGYEAAVGPAHVWTGMVLNQLGAVQLETQDFEDARATFDRAVAVFSKLEGGDPLALAQAKFGLAQALWETGGDREQALELARQAGEGGHGDSVEARGLENRLDRWRRMHAPKPGP